MLVSAHIAASVRTRIETSLLPPLTTVWRFTWSAWRRMRDSNSRGLAPNTLSKSVDVRSRQVSGSVTWSGGLVQSSANAVEPRRMRPELRPARSAVPNGFQEHAVRRCSAALLAGLSAAVLAAAFKPIPCISRVPFGALAACWPPSICSVGVGGLSRTVQRWPSAGPLFQPCRLASVAGYGLGSSRAPQSPRSPKA